MQAEPDPVQSVSESRLSALAARAWCSRFAQRAAGRRHRHDGAQDTRRRHRRGLRSTGRRSAGPYRREGAPARPSDPHPRTGERMNSIAGAARLLAGCRPLRCCCGVAAALRTGPGRLFVFARDRHRVRRDRRVPPCARATRAGRRVLCARPVHDGARRSEAGAGGQSQHDGGVQPAWADLLEPRRSGPCRREFQARAADQSARCRHAAQLWVVPLPAQALRRGRAAVRASNCAAAVPRQRAHVAGARRVSRAGGSVGRGRAIVAACIRARSGKPRRPR